MLETGDPVLEQFLGEELYDLWSPPQIFPQLESNTRPGKVLTDGIFIFIDLR